MLQDRPFFLKYWPLLLAILLASCKPEPIEVKNIPIVDPEIVVSSQILPGQILLVWLSRTFGALEVREGSNPEEVLKSIVVNDALVTLTGPAGTDTLMLLEEGIYRSPRIAFKAGESYELRVKSETLGEVKAVSSVEDQVVFQSLEGKLSYDFYDDPLLNISYSIQDPLEKNQYMINAHKFTGDSASIIRNVFNPKTSTLLLDDTEFNGLAYENFFDFSPPGYEAGDTVLVSLSNISEEYYQFMELRMENRLDFIQFLSDPVNFPTNVAGGKGFFNLHLPDFRTLIVD